MSEERVFVFDEPHYTGGNARVEITESQVVRFMKENYPDRGFSDEELVESFVINNWAWEKTSPADEP